MTEVPDHLLRRSKERREALGLAPEGEAGAAPASSEAGAEASAVPAVGAGAGAAPAAAAPVAAAPAAAAVEKPPPPPPPPFVTAARNRAKIPLWALPVLAALPVWAIIYAGTLATPDPAAGDETLALGEEIYASAACASCHGANGGGGIGPKLSGGEAELTFADPMDHFRWVVEGSPGGGTPYGDADRPGGQRISEGEPLKMPAFGEQLTEEEIIAVVRYEREVLSQAEPWETAEDDVAGGAGEGEGGSEEDDTEGAEGTGGDVGGDDGPGEGGG